MPEKPAFIADFTSETFRIAGFDPTNRVPFVRFEIIFGQKILARKFVGRIFFGPKVENPKKFWIVIHC